MTTPKQKDPIGDEIKALRKERKLSVPALAGILDIPKDRIYKWEAGDASPKYEDRQILAKWKKNPDWRNVPHETDMMVNEEEVSYNAEKAAYIRKSGQEPQLLMRWLQDKEEIISTLKEHKSLRTDLDALQETIKGLAETVAANNTLLNKIWKAAAAADPDEPKKYGNSGRKEKRI